MTNTNQQLYLNINYNYNSNKFEYDVDNYTWSDYISYKHKLYFKTSDKCKLKIWLDLNGLKLHKRIILPHLLSPSRTYSLIEK